MPLEVPPPRDLPSVIIKQKASYNLWSAIRRDMPVIERMGMGDKIENLFLSILEITFLSSYQDAERKIVSLGYVISKIDALKFFIQIAWERKLVSTEKYSEISLQLEEVGRMLGGWRKGLLNKTPTK